MFLWVEGLNSHANFSTASETHRLHCHVFLLWLSMIPPPSPYFDRTDQVYVTSPLVGVITRSQLYRS